MKKNRLVAYYRLSKEKKTRTAAKSTWGWSLESQQTDVDKLASQLDATIIASYQEIETGKRSDRPQLSMAIAHAKRASAKLCIARLDRLARNVHFVSGLMESGVDFVACDMPFANRLTVHILAAVAEHEAEQISQRTKNALAVAKQKGVKLGGANPKCRNLSVADRWKGNRAATRALKKLAREAYEDLRELFERLRPDISYRGIARLLNEQGQRTRQGKSWSGATVMRACRQLGIQ